jgi:hypothetical protein
VKKRSVESGQTDIIKAARANLENRKIAIQHFSSPSAVATVADRAEGGFLMMTDGARISSWVPFLQMWNLGRSAVTTNHAGMTND